MAATIETENEEESGNRHKPNGYGDDHKEVCTSMFLSCSLFIFLASFTFLDTATKVSHKNTLAIESNILFND
jgi:hypothetical protein